MEYHDIYKKGDTVYIGYTENEFKQMEKLNNLGMKSICLLADIVINSNISYDYKEKIMKLINKTE